MCGSTARAERALELVPSAAREARTFLRSAGCPEHATELLEPAILLVSELVTNAVLHGGPPVVVAVDCDEVSLQVFVRDGGKHLPIARVDDPLAESGRGMQLVAMMSEDWGVEPEPDGKTVWFRLTA